MAYGLRCSADIRRTSSATIPPMRILITAGPTREYLDSVRFLSNPSTGRMGCALAQAAARRGHKVTLVSGPVPLPPPPGVRCVPVTSAAEMLAESRRAFARCDVAIFTAAVCDYRPVRRNARKLPKMRTRWTLELEPTDDIAATLGRTKGRRITIAFALEDHDARAHAQEKLRRKHCDAIILNSPESIGAEHIRAELYTPDLGWKRWPELPKRAAATRIIRLTEQLLAARMAHRTPKSARSPRS